MKIEDKKKKKEGEKEGERERSCEMFFVSKDENRLKQDRLNLKYLEQFQNSCNCFKFSSSDNLRGYSLRALPHEIGGG